MLNMYVIVVGPHSNTNSQNNFICPRQMKGFMDGIQILQVILGQSIPIRFYDPCFTRETKIALENMYRENGMNLEVMIQIFDDSEKERYFRMKNPILMISFIGAFDLKTKEQNITYIQCSCDYGRDTDIEYSWTNILPELITQRNEIFDFTIPWPSFIDMTIFDLSDFYEKSKSKSWFEIVRFQINFVLSSKKYLIFNEKTPEFIFQWCHKNPEFILTNNSSLINFCHNLVDKDFNFDENDKRILINSWSNYRRVYNIDF
jgi:hypothetical protein